jgi:hypothetical protein
MLPVGGIGLRGGWQALTADAVERTPGQLGVYEIVDGSGEVVCIGVADARQPFGLRSALGDEMARWGPGYRFRLERTHAYRSRHLELLMLHLHDRGRLPAGNHEDPASLGRLSPG